MFKVFFDTETTGLSHATDRVLEFAAVKTDENFNIVDTLHLYINPEMQVPEVAVKVHGLDNAFLADKPKFEEVVEKIINFMQGSHAIAHNAPYDVGMLDAEFARVGIGRFSCVPAFVEDSADLSRLVNPGRPANLDAICDRFGISRTHRTFHGALLDCELLISAYQALLVRRSEVQQALQVVLGFDPFADVSQLADEKLAAGYTLASGLETMAKRLKDKFATPLRQIADNTDMVNEKFEVKFSERVLVDWDRVRKTYLAETDLTDFEQRSVACRIKAFGL